MSEWLTLPTCPDNEWVLVVGYAGIIEVAMRKEMRNGKKGWWNGDGYWPLSTFSRWMHLPEIPDEILDDGARLGKKRSTSPNPS